MKKKKRAGINCLVPFLFAVYMVLPVWIILFKLQLSIHDLDTVRNIKLIPFHYENEIGMIGIGLYWSAVKIFRGKKRADTVIMVVAAIVTAVVVGGVSVLLISN